MELFGADFAIVQFEVTEHEYDVDSRHGQAAMGPPHCGFGSDMSDHGAV